MSDDKPSVHVEFFMQAIEDVAASKAQGRPIYTDVEMVRLKYTGDTKRNHVAPAGEKYRRNPETNEWVSFKEDFPKHYELFKNGQAQLVSGTPLSELPFLSEAKRAELRAVNVHTAENLASLDGALLERLGMGGRSLKNQAQAYIDKAAAGVTDSRILAENEALREKIAHLESLVSLKETEMPQNDASSFDTWHPDDLKRYIEERTGSRPRGNPAHATLVATAKELSQSEAV